MSSPTQRSLKWLRDRDYTATVVEKKVPGRFISQDLFGCIDILAIKPGEILGVQATTATNQAARMTKARALDTLKTWLQAGGRFEVHGWSKKGAAGKRKLWQVTRREALLDTDLVEAADGPGQPTPQTTPGDPAG